MQAGQFSRFTRLDVLMGIGRNLLVRFLESFPDAVAAQNLSLPRPGTPDPEYFQAVADIFGRPDLLPETLLEALFAIEEMSDPGCRQQIQTALAELRSNTPSLQNSTTPILHSPEAPPEHFAIQVWLTIPAFLAGLERYTLDPLRTDGPDALTVEDVPGIRKATLRRVALVWNNAFHEVITIQADDVFRCASADRDYCDFTSESARLTQATLDFEFEDSTDRYTVEIYPPKLLKLRPDCHAPLVKRWLSKRGFRITTQQTARRSSPPDVQSMVSA